jgi:hypothetical protein
MLHSDCPLIVRPRFVAAFCEQCLFVLDEHKSRFGWSLDIIRCSFELSEILTRGLWSTATFETISVATSKAVLREVCNQWSLSDSTVAVATAERIPCVALTLTAWFQQPHHSYTMKTEDLLNRGSHWKLLKRFLDCCLRFCSWLQLGMVISERMLIIWWHLFETCHWH